MQPSRRLSFFVTAVFILVGAAYLRFHQIERRPLHADEAVQAYQTWQLLRGDGYTYDPADKHGPFLYYATSVLAEITNRSPAALDVTWFRSVTLLAGLGTIVLLIGAAGHFGRVSALIGAAVLAVAPIAIIYDTYFVQEAWFCLFTWALFFATLKWLEKPAWFDAVLIGVLAGLMQATKETSVLHFAALGAALMVARPWRELLLLWRQVLLALFAAFLVYLVFYSAFFTRWDGVADGVLSYFNYAARAAGSAHDQPRLYYVSMLWPHVREGVSWGEPLLLVMALVGINFAFSARAQAPHRMLAVFTLTLLLIYSFISYKTPWLLLTPYVGLALLAGIGVAQSADWRPAKLWRFAPACLCCLLLVEGVWRDRSAIGRYANDDRNPYIYQPTSPDLARLVTVLAALPAHWKVAVISPDHAWPLPWYLRDRRATGYFTTAPATIAEYDLVLYDSRLDAPAPIAATIYGLRPNVILWHSTQ